MMTGSNVSHHSADLARDPMPNLREKHREMTACYSECHQREAFLTAEDHIEAVQARLPVPAQWKDHAGDPEAYRTACERYLGDQTSFLESPNKNGLESLRKAEAALLLRGRQSESDFQIIASKPPNTAEFQDAYQRTKLFISDRCLPDLLRIRQPSIRALEASLRGFQEAVLRLAESNGALSESPQLRAA